MENDFLKLWNSLSSEGQGVKVLNRNLRRRGQELLARVRATARRTAPKPLLNRLAAAGKGGANRASSPQQAASEGRKEGGPPAGHCLAGPERKPSSSGSSSEPRSPPRRCLSGAVRPRPAPRVKAKRHLPYFATPVGMCTPWGAGDSGYSYPSAVTPFRSAKCNFRAGQGFSEP